MKAGKCYFEIIAILGNLIWIVKQHVVMERTLDFRSEVLDFSPWLSTKILNNLYNFSDYVSLSAK